MDWLYELNRESHIILTTNAKIKMQGSRQNYGIYM